MWPALKQFYVGGGALKLFGVCNLWQVSALIPIRQWIQDHHKTKKTFKSDRELKKYILHDLGMSLQTDPRTGQLCVPVQKETLMVSGVRTSATRVKEEVHQTRDGAKESYAKNAAATLQGARTNAQDNRTLGVALAPGSSNFGCEPSYHIIYESFIVLSLLIIIIIIMNHESLIITTLPLLILYC